MNHMYRWGVVFVTVVIVFSGCTAIDLTRLQPPSSEFVVCNSTQRALLEDTSKAVGESFSFILPPAAAELTRAEKTWTIGRLSVKGEPTFTGYLKAMQNTKQRLPVGLKDDAVVNAFFAMMVKTSAQARIDMAKARYNSKDAAKQEPEVQKYAVPTRLTHCQLKKFADKLFDAQLRPKLVNPTNRAAMSVVGNALAKYFVDYYEGNFYDRFGQPVEKPKISLTIPDSEIAAALTVLLEYLFDLFDPTPVMGDSDPDKLGEKTKFYPGNNNNKPTALNANLAIYQKIVSDLPPGGCGVTTKNVMILKDLAYGAGDAAASLGGLVSQSAGGLGVSLGVFGKMSIGDNQTLGTIVKTAASRLATRLTLASSFWALQSLKLPEVPTSRALKEMEGAENYLSFPGGQ